MNTASKIRRVLLVLREILAPFRFVFMLALFALVLLEIFTPSLNFRENIPAAYRSDTPAGWTETSSLQSEKTYRTSILTDDYRQVQLDFFAPPNFTTAPIPLTIIASPFMLPEWVISKVRPRGFNAVLVYTTNRLERVQGPAFPTLAQLSAASSPKDYWSLIASNPVNYAYNLHAALHEAPADIANIVRWAKANANIDGSRINLIGLGVGSLQASSAALALQAAGIPARTLTLINPPANMPSAIQDNLSKWPTWLRRPIAWVLSKLYFRLDLTRSLPYLNEKTARLIVLPVNSFELATYAAEPALALAGPKAGAVRIDMKYNGYYDDTYINTVRDTVGKWLVEAGGLQTY